MKRILFIGTGDKFPKGSLAFLQNLQEQYSFCVTGLFFCPFDYDLLASASHVPIAAPYVRVREKEKEIVAAQKEEFRRQCSLRHIKFHVHENDEAWNKELFVKESRFSDLIVVSAELFCEDGGDNQPNVYLQEALHASECPVVVIPEKYQQPAYLVIGYDGTKDSVFAIKQFCHLFPNFTDLPTELVYIRDERSENIPDLEELKLFAQLHFGSLGLSKLHFNAVRYFSDWLNEKSPVMLVTGSYGRSVFSYMAKKSFASKAIHDHAMPVFIAHT